jgi:cytochrome o ubiquinol oxidase subunit 1
MIIAGVVFGFFAGLTYWFPKIFGFTLHEGLGKLAAWLWTFGFVLAFGPLYILGLMGATRRLDHYDASLGWQSLFVVAGIGVLTICAGVAVQLLQLGYSIWKRKENIDTTGDPWGARTLEWATTSPPPEYNFAVLPEVTTRDAFWEMKLAKPTSRKPVYEDIRVPANTPDALYIAVLAFLASFGFIWHIWWLAIIGVLGAVLVMFWHGLSDEEGERLIPAHEVAVIEAAAQGRRKVV